MEQWREIPGFPGYQISDQGRVLGLRGLIMRQKTKRDNVMSIGLRVSIEGQRIQRCPHVGRLVLITFKGEHPTKNILRHINGNPQDNRLENLVWSTFPANANAAVKRGTMKSGEQSKQSKLTYDKVSEIRERYNLVGTNHLSIEVLSKIHSVNRRTISDVIHWRRWKNPPHKI